MYDESSRENVRRCGRKNAVGKQSLLERYQGDTEVRTSCGRIKCQRLVDHVYPVLSFGSDIWSWKQQTM